MILNISIYIQAVYHLAQFMCQCSLVFLIQSITIIFIIMLVGYMCDFQIAGDDQF
jgi:hypothetical protein